MKLWLAPMEGVVDSILREYMGQFGGLDYTVTEFIRVTNQLLPDSVFYRYCPELATQSKTKSGLPVHIQLLGGDPDALAENAARVAELGAIAIDLNFGCPAKTVNRHDGGAALLTNSTRLHNIVRAVRKAVPEQIPVSAKIRLGFNNPADCLENAPAIAEGGASHLTVHCRTKTDMYKPPAFWEWIPRIQERILIPIVANGEIWTVEDLESCRQQTGCSQFMLGRGALRDPLLFAKCKGLIHPTESLPLAKIIEFYEINLHEVSPAFATARTKQWLRNMANRSQELQRLFDQLKVITSPTEFLQTLRRSGESFT